MILLFLKKVGLKEYIDLCMFSVFRDLLQILTISRWSQTYKVLMNVYIQLNEVTEVKEKYSWKNE